MVLRKLCELANIVVVAALFTTGCNRPAAPPAASEAPASVTTVTSADTLTTPDTRDGYRDAVRREQRELDAKLDEALATLDRQLGTRPEARSMLRTKRARLAADQRLIAKSDERGWDELKAEIERDLYVTGED